MLQGKLYVFVHRFTQPQALTVGYYATSDIVAENQKT